MFLLIFYILGWLAGIALVISGKADSIWLNMLYGQMFGTIGLGLVFNAAGHLFKSEQVARSIGWTANGFQKELGFVSLGLGVCGVISVWLGSGFQLAVIIITAFFLFGAAGVHVKEMRRQNNFNKGNTLIILPDILIPLTAFILWLMAS